MTNHAHLVTLDARPKKALQVKQGMSDTAVCLVSPLLLPACTDVISAWCNTAVLHQAVQHLYTWAMPLDFTLVCARGTGRLTADCNSSLPVSMPFTGFWVRLCAYWNSLVVMA